MGLLFGCSTVVVVLSLVSLAFLILATITAPASGLALAQAGSLSYGVFGYCKSTGGSCVLGSPWYNVSSLTTVTDWKMNDTARDTLAKILIVTPVAAGLTLISFLFNLFAHCKVFGSSLAFYIIGFIFALLAFFASALTVIVVFLLFYPHVQWPAWLLIPAGILNLLSVPLVFFAMRTGPSSTSADEQDEEMVRGNLTDLTDGDDFKNTSYSLNDFSNIPKTTDYLSEKLSAPTVKVLTDDSSLNGSNYEKVSMRDYSKNTASDPEVSAYRAYSYSNQPSALHTGEPQTDGTPNLVSTQNYTRAGAVRAEALSVQPQSVKPDFGGMTPTYPSSQYQETPNEYSDAPSLQQQSLAQSQFNSSAAPSYHPPSSQYAPSPAYQPEGYNQSSSLSRNTQRQGDSFTPSGPLLSDPTSAPYPISAFEGSGANVMESSNHNSIPDDADFELNDNDSDFTSVSQRAANPGYYGGLQNQNQGPTLFRAGQQQQFPPQGAPQFVQSPAVYQQAPPQSYNGGYASAAQQAPQAPAVDHSDFLLSHNPDFKVGGAASKKNVTNKRANPALAGGYRPAYRRLQNGSKGLPSASMSTDSPYNIR